MVDQGIPHLFKNGNKNPKVEKMVGGGGVGNPPAKQCCTLLSL
jgi:hypothetical protein